MIWAVFVCLTLAVLAPLAATLTGPAAMRGRRDSELALHRAALAELERERAEARLGAREYDAARLEVSRRLLAAGEDAEPQGRSRSFLLFFTIAFVPVAAFLLYLPNAAPNLPDAPLAVRRAAEAEQTAHAAQLATALRAKIATLDPHSDAAREGDILLGNLLDTQGNLSAAADAWQAALAIRFDATLAAETAEARSRVEGRVSPASAALFRAALAAAPKDAPWRNLVSERLSEAAK